MEVELQRLEEKAAQIRAWLGRLPARVRRQVKGITGGNAKVKAAASPTTSGRKIKRTMSAQARRRISEAQKARWAKQKRVQAAAPSESSQAEATVTAPKGKDGRRRGMKKTTRVRRRKAKA
jgi:hypothetical protein